ncbi:hypothetical protein D3C87_280230 [compost metagenome]
MSYVIPSVLVYQQLQSSGGVANTTPDLEACIIGPAYNVLEYIAGSTTSLVNTAATASTTAVGSMAAGSKVVTFTTPVPFAIGDNILIPGASSTAGTLSAIVVTVSGLTATVDVAAGTAVTNVTVTKTGVISNSTVPNTFNLPNQKPGQVLDAASVQVYLNNAKIETLVSGFYGISGDSDLFISAPAGITGTMALNANTVTAVSDPTRFVVGDEIVVAGAGASGAALHAEITDITGSVFTLNVTAGTAVTGAAVTKDVVSNVNSTTSTLRVEAGDAVDVEYKNTSGVMKTFPSSVTDVQLLTGAISNVQLADVLPTDVSAKTTVASATAGAASITVASATGILAGDTIVIKGAGAGGSDLYTVVGTVSSNTLSGLTPTITTAVTNAAVTRQALVTLKTRKLYNNQLLPATRPLTTGANYDASSAGTSGQITINPNSEVIYGRVFSGEVHFAYRALRTDLSGVVQTISVPDDITGILGDPSDRNPLALGVQLALANTTTQVRAIAISSDDLLGYQDAMELAEGQRLYALAPLTQEVDILAAFQAHVDQLSTPQEALWRIALVNTAIPTNQNIGPYSEDFVNANGGNNTITVIAGKYVLTASNATFMSDGVTPGDIVNVTASTGTPSQVGTLQVQQVLNNQQVVVAATGTGTAVSYYVTRQLTKTQKAQAVAAASKTFMDKRIIHVQPDTVGVTIDGVVKYLPGYYLCAALAGMVAGFPVQQGFTNVGVAGISDLKYSNFYFTRAQMNTMAEAGTFLFVQETQGSIPYVRHELTTDVSVLEYRELLVVKNWDWLSYAYRDVLMPFIGKWNITSDTLNTIRQTIVSASELYKGQKLPKIGAPLLSYNILELKQDPNNKDSLIINLQITVVYPLNYVNLYLII